MDRDAEIDSSSKASSGKMHRLTSPAPEASGPAQRDFWAAGHKKPEGDEDTDQDTDQEHGDVHSKSGTNDQEDMKLANKSIDEQLADLESTMNTCKQRRGSGSEAEQAALDDPLVQLRHQFDSLREEVLGMSSVKKEMESDLHQNVQKLQERVDHQHKEKLLLTERLMEIKQKIEAKRQEMMDWEQEMCFQIAAENAGKQRTHADWSEGLQALRSQLSDCNRQIQDDWESQVALLAELDAESEAQAQLQSQLHEARERAWRQNQDSVRDIARNGKARTLSLLYTLSDKPIQASGCFNTMNDVTATEQWMTHQQVARQNEEFTKQAEAEKLRLKELESDLLEQQKAISLRTLESASAVDRLKQKLLYFRQQGTALENSLSTWQPHGPPFTPPRTSYHSENSNQGEGGFRPSGVHEDYLLSTSGRSPGGSRRPSFLGSQDGHLRPSARSGAGSLRPSVRSQDGSLRPSVSVLGTHPPSSSNPFLDAVKEDERAAEHPEIDMAWSAVENLHRCVQDIEQKKDELKQLNELWAAVQKCRAEKASKSLENETIQRKEQKLAEVVEEYDKAEQEKKSVESLRDEVQEHKVTLETLRAQNNALQMAIRDQQKRCFRGARGASIPRTPKIPPPDKGRSRGRDKGSDNSRDGAVQIDSSTPSKTTPDRSDTTTSDRTSPEALPLVGADGSVTWEPSVDQRRDEKAQWSEAHAFFVCKVGEETWEPGSQLVPTVVCHDDGRPVSSVGEAVDLLKKSDLESDDCILVQDASSSSWYCLWRRGKKGTARRMMDGFVRDDLPASSRHNRSRNGRHRGERSSSREPDVGGGPPPLPPPASKPPSGPGRQSSSTVTGGHGSSQPHAHVDEL